MSTPWSWFNPSSPDPELHVNQTLQHFLALLLLWQRCPRTTAFSWLHEPCTLSGCTTESQEWYDVHVIGRIFTRNPERTLRALPLPAASLRSCDIAEYVVTPPKFTLEGPPPSRQTSSQNALTTSGPPRHSPHPHLDEQEGGEQGWHSASAEKSANVNKMEAMRGAFLPLRLASALSPGRLLGSGSSASAQRRALLPQRLEMF
ncbi:unnamed protein product [Lota lota]